AGNLAVRAVTDWGAQIVSWASLLVVVRVLAPADFGLVAMSGAFYSFLRLAGEFGIPITIMTLRDLTDEEIAQLHSVAVMLGVGAFLVACACAWPVAFFFKTPRVVPVIVVSCLALIPLAMRSVPEGVMSKELRFKPLSWFNAIRDMVAAITTVALALLGFSYWSLVIGNLLSVTLRSVLIFAACRQRFAWPNFAAVKRPLLFSWHVLVSTFAWSSYNTLDNVTVGRVLGQASLGFYGMAWTLANMPLEKVVSLVTTIIPSYLAKVQKEPAELRRYLHTLTEALALATFPATIGLALVARELIPIALGRKWDSMIVPLEVLCLYTAFRSIEALMPKLLTAVGNARFVMWVELSALVIMPISFYLGSHWGVGGVAVAWLAYPVATAPLYWKTLKTIQMKPSEYFSAVRPGLDGAIAMAIAVGLLKWKIPASEPAVLRLILEMAVGAIVYTGTVFLLHRDRAMSFLQIAKRMRGKKKQS
ncbi:MAG TPA: lipopolysaccharide biosynthesis protein, partial [Terriglobales bacterium]|nr:lipopolysaccharide biosynthesis protein [Terriglobales bacterium]